MIKDEDRPLVWRLREAARLCSNMPYAAALRDIADRLNLAIADFWQNQNAEAMRAMNGIWGNADRILKNTPPEGTPDPTSGDVEPARLAA